MKDTIDDFSHIKWITTIMLSILFGVFVSQQTGWGDGAMSFNPEKPTLYNSWDSIWWDFGSGLTGAIILLFAFLPSLLFGYAYIKLWDYIVRKGVRR